MIATGRKGHIVSIQQGQDGDVLTVEVEDVGMRALRPNEVRPLAPQIVSCVAIDRSVDNGRGQAGVGGGRKRRRGERDLAEGLGHILIRGLYFAALVNKLLVLVV